MNEWILVVLVLLSYVLIGLKVVKKFSPPVNNRSEFAAAYMIVWIWPVLVVGGVSAAIVSLLKKKR